MNYNPSHRVELCQSSEAVTAHHVLVENEILRRHLNVALLEYQQRLYRLTKPDLGSCASCQLKMDGVQEFLELFYNLCETSQASPRTDSTNLPGNVKPMAPKRN